MEYHKRVIYSNSESSEIFKVSQKIQKMYPTIRNISRVRWIFSGWVVGLVRQGVANTGKGIIYQGVVES